MRRFRYRIGQQYVGWISRFLRFLGRRHPEDVCGLEVELLLSPLASQRHVAAATQAQDLAAPLLLYKRVLNVDLIELGSVIHASRPRHPRAVLARVKSRRKMARFDEQFTLIASLLYGSGLRLLDALRPHGARAHATAQIYLHVLDPSGALRAVGSID